MNKKYLIAGLILGWLFSLVAVYSFAKAPNPGHQWDQIGCEGDPCNLTVDKNGNVTSALNFSIYNPMVPGGKLTASIGVDNNAGAVYVKALNENVITIDTNNFTVNRQVKLKGIDSTGQVGTLQVSCSGGKCYAVYAD